MAMEEPMSEAFRTATEGLQSTAASAASETERQVRENAPRLIQSARKSFNEANDYVGELVDNRSIATLLAVGALGLVIGLFASRR
jgi:hypothetical protein